MNRQSTFLEDFQRNTNAMPESSKLPLSDEYLELFRIASEKAGFLSVTEWAFSILASAVARNDHWTDDYGVVHIKLTQGQEALVDATDYPKVAGYKWYALRAKNTFYAVSNLSGGTSIRMHHLIIDIPDGLVGDHKFGNGLDNRRDKLRIVTCRVNCQNQQNRQRPKSSKHPGVYWNTTEQTWYVHIQVAGTRIHLGRFSKEEEAAECYRSACRDVENGTFRRPSRTKSSEHIGVSLDRRTQRFSAYIQTGGKRYHLGCFDNELDASHAHECARAKVAAGQFSPKVWTKSSSHEGVSLDRKVNKFRAYIAIAGKHKHLGYFESETMAAQAVWKAREELLYAKSA